MEAIFIFTKDRPHILSQTLQTLEKVPYLKFIVDDSIAPNTQKEVLGICEQFQSYEYLGNGKFEEFCNNHKIIFPKFSFLLRNLGNKEWNLGYARNFALLYARAKQFNKVLFIDDDIHVSENNIIDDLFANLNAYKFTGANIEGLIDNSILGHIADSVQVKEERMLSGGFMAFSPVKINQYFLNIYNEDWIWLFLQLQNDKYLQTGSVFQALSNPFDNYSNKVIFQEIGEIALDGILDLYKNGSYDSLIQLSFWERIIQEREGYLELLANKTRNTGNKKKIKIINWVKNNSGNFKAELFQKLFEDYFTNRITFLKLYSSL